MGIVHKLLQNKVNKWIAEERQNSQSVISDLLKHIEDKKQLRDPQRQAIEVFLWLKFIGKNQKLADIVRQGLLCDESFKSEYEFFSVFEGNHTAQFLYQFAKDSESKNLEKELIKDKNNPDWQRVLDDLLHDFPYSNYLYSLPMGAGKTYLMACFIYLDLYFASIYKDDKRFAHNFIVFAPSAAKTAILPSLRTIKDFNPEWLFPKGTADRLKQIIHIEILDSLASARKDKLQGNNPNLEKVNRLCQSKDFGLVFITNAEKVILEKYDKNDEIYTKPGTMYYDEKKASEIKKTNELRERMSQLPYFAVILDEVHHTYASGDEEKKLRQAVEVLNQHGNVNSILGFSGTPYVKSKISVMGKDIRLNQIQDIVYDYKLNRGIGNFLKVPDIREADFKENAFVKKALTDFFKDFDITYTSGAKSKIAFYCPSIEKLNEEILPVVQEWYQENRPKYTDEIFVFYTNTGKKDEKYRLPKDSLAIFHNLDKPYSKKRIVLLVAIGTEGWDCKSLTAVALPRKETTKNFVLQTTCRCLREVDNAEQEKALVYLTKENYKTLDAELQENYKLTIQDLKPDRSQSISAVIRKPKLGKLKYKQIKHKYTLVKTTTADPVKCLQSYTFDYYRKTFAYDTDIVKARIGGRGLTAETREAANLAGSNQLLTLEDFVYKLNGSLYGKYDESELLARYEKHLEKIKDSLNENVGWIANHPVLVLEEIIQDIAANFADSREYQREIIKEDVEIELLEWKIPSPKISCIDSNGKHYALMPKIPKEDFRTYSRDSKYLEEDFFQKNNIDPHDLSFNYIPYRMDSEFEQNALVEMLKLSELVGLEVYFNGYRNDDLNAFYIETPRGRYTPDFLVLKRKDGKKYKRGEKGEIEKILILETKGKVFYTDEFKAKEKFVLEEFTKHNSNFAYHCCVDDGDNDFTAHIATFKQLLKNF